MGIIIIKVMHDAVAEMRRKDLALLRLVDDKASGWQRLVSAQNEVVTQTVQIHFEVGFKSQLVWLVALVATGVKIGLTEINKKSFSRQAINGILGKVLTDRAHSEAIVAVVVVHVAIVRIEVEVPSVVRVVGVERARPVVAVGACVVELTVPAVASGRQEEPTLC